LIERELVEQLLKNDWKVIYPFELEGN